MLHHLMPTPQTSACPVSTISVTELLEKPQHVWGLLTLRTLRLRLRLKKRPLPEEARLYTGTPRYSRLLTAANCGEDNKVDSGIHRWQLAVCRAKLS